MSGGGSENTAAGEHSRRSSRQWLTGSAGDAEELHNILTLCLDTLEGDIDARAILADLLEESGRGRAAKLARAEEDDNDAQLAIILGALPGRGVLLLGADFLERILVRDPEEFRGKGSCLYALNRVRSWCRREVKQFPTSPVILFEENVSQRELRLGSGYRRETRNTEWRLARAFRHFACGIRSVIAEHEVAPVGERVWFDQIGEADTHVLAAAREAREQASTGLRNEEFSPSRELAWQLKRTSEFLIRVGEALRG